MMGPSLPEHKKDQSSESDEESNIRHDRFRSERFQEKSDHTAKLTQRKERFRHNERIGSRQHRVRSPPRSYRHKEVTSSSTHRYHSRNDFERKDGDRGQQFKCAKSNKSERSVNEKTHAEVNESENKDEVRTKANKLSSLLKNFDKNLESKRTNTETQSEMGPALPPQIVQKAKSDESITNNLVDVALPVGPTLPPKMLKINEKSNGNDTIQALGQASLPCHSNIKVKIDPEISATRSPVHHPFSIEPEISLNKAENISRTGLENNFDSTNLVNSRKSDVLEPSAFGPVLPPKKETEAYGPALPPDTYGPALPLSLKKDILGPSLPSSKIEETESLAEDESEDEDIVGPLPEGKTNMTQYQLDLRAMHIKRKLEEEKSGPSKDIKKREEWMLELPPEKATNLGLGPRSFRMREAPDMSNRSSWTDTPADKLRKEEQVLRGETEQVSSEEMMRTAFLKEREEEMDTMAQLSQDKDRPHSLLELHQKKLKKKKKKDDKEGKKKERRPFDRNVDLQVNRFDDAQKKAIFKKAQLLNSRFSSGESKYL